MAQFAAHGLAQVLVTLGSQGSVVLDSTSATPVVRIAPTRVDAVDTTGAGDAFTGGVAARLAAGDSLVDAARYASVSAAMAATRKGTQTAYPTAAEVSGFRQAPVAFVARGCNRGRGDFSPVPPRRLPASLSRRQPRQTGCRSFPLPVHSPKVTSPTSLALTQWASEASAARHLVEGRGLAGQGVQLLPQFLQFAGAEAAAHPAHVAQFGAVRDAHQQRAHGCSPPALARPPAAHHHFLGPLQLELEPGPAALPLT